MSFLLAALVLAVAGCAAIYLCSPNQRWLTRPWPTGPACSLGLALLAASAVVFGQHMQTITVVFVLVTLLMLAFVLLPYLGALHHPERGTR